MLFGIKEGTRARGLLEEASYLYTVDVTCTHAFDCRCPSCCTCMSAQTLPHTAKGVTKRRSTNDI